MSCIVARPPLPAARARLSGVLRAPLRCAAVLLLAAGLAPAAGSDDLLVAQPWSRPTPPAVATGVVYLSITNRGLKADRLTALSSPAARSVELHESRNVDGMMQMRQLAGVDCPAGATVKIEPGGMHIMLLGLVRPLVDGAEFPLDLRFRDAGEVIVQVHVHASESGAAQSGPQP